MIIFHILIKCKHFIFSFSQALTVGVPWNPLSDDFISVTRIVRWNLRLRFYLLCDFCSWVQERWNTNETHLLHWSRSNRSSFILHCQLLLRGVEVPHLLLRAWSIWRLAAILFKPQLFLCIVDALCRRIPAWFLLKEVSGLHHTLEHSFLQLAEPLLINIHWAMTANRSLSMKVHTRRWYLLSHKWRYHRVSSEFWGFRDGYVLKEPLFILLVWFGFMPLMSLLQKAYSFLLIRTNTLFILHFLLKFNN